MYLTHVFSKGFERMQVDCIVIGEPMTVMGSFHICWTLQNDGGT